MTMSASQDSNQPPPAPEATRPVGRSRHHRWMVSPDKVSLVRPVVPPRPVEIKARPKDVVFDAARTALIVVDMQNDFLHEDGWFGLRGANLEPLHRPVEALKRLTSNLRPAGIPIVWLNWGVRGDCLDLPPNVFHSGTYSGSGISIGDRHPTRGYRILEQGAWGAEVIDSLLPAPDDIRVHKVRLSGFWDTDLDGILRNQGITTLLFGGVNLDRCVMATLQDASYRGYDCILVDDCTSTVHPEFAVQSCHLTIQQLLGFVTASDQVIEGVKAIAA